MVWMWVGAALAASECPERAVWLDRALQAVNEGEVEAGQKALDESVRYFACDDARPVDISRYFQLQGALWYAQDRQEDAKAAFAAAQSAAPNALDPGLTGVFADLYRAPIAPAPVGQLQLDKPEYTALIQGAPATLPASLPGGYYLVQVQQDGALIAARVARVLPGETVEVSTLALDPFSSEPKRRKGLLLAASGAAVLGGAAAGGAVAMGSTLDDHYAAGNEASYQQSARQAEALAIGAYSLWGVAGAAAVAWVVW